MLSLLFVQAEENAGTGGTSEDESSNDVNLEVRNLIFYYLLHVQLLFQSSKIFFALCECSKVQFKLPPNLTFAV